jgi:hypothetical protein
MRGLQTTPYLSKNEKDVSACGPAEGGAFDPLKNKSACSQPWREF